MIERKASSRPGVQHPKSWLGAGAALTVVVLCTLIYFVHFYGPREHDNPSFHFGQKVMTHDVYGSVAGGSVEDACRAALATANGKPHSLDVEEAVSGCKYQEYELDN
jgi:hypothetical protein